MAVNENDIYLFNPGYEMRNDSHRIVLFAGNKPNRLSEAHWGSFLHPLHARIFSFFTYNRPIKATISLLGKYLKRDEQSIRKIVYPFIENSSAVFTNYNDEKVWIPKNIIINRNHISGEVAFLNLNPNVFGCCTIDLTTQRNYTAPQFFTFMLNNDCISQCIYCYADKKTKVGKRLTTNRILELIAEASALPVRFINLTGGEIFLHHDWFVILKKLVDFNLSPEYISTKYPLSDVIIDTIRNSGFTNPIQISLDACSSGVLMKTLSVPNDYLIKIMRGIKLLDNSGLKYRINSVLSICNTKKEIIEKLFIYISLLKNVTDWRITPAVNSNWIEYEQFRKLKPDKKEIESLYEWIENELIPKSKIPILLNRPVINREFGRCSTGSADFKGMRCPALNNQMFILPDGKVTICEQLYWMPQFIIGDVTKSGISEVWNSPAAQRLLNLQKTDIQDKSPCKTCRLFEPCFNVGNRCWVDIVKAYGKENWDFPDPRCAFAPEMINDLRF